MVITGDLLFDIWGRCHTENGRRLTRHERDSGWLAQNPRPSLLRQGAFSLHFDASGKTNACTHWQSNVAIGDATNPLPDYVHIADRFNVKARTWAPRLPPTRP